MDSIVDDLLKRGVAFIPAKELMGEAARVLALAQRVLGDLPTCPPLEKRTMFPEALPIAPGPSRRVIQCFLARMPDISEPEPGEVTKTRGQIFGLCCKMGLFARQILQGLAQHCALPRPMMKDLLDPQEWVLNAVHYPFEGEAGRLLFPAHRDWGTLAIYPLIQGAGLEMNLDGEWTPVQVPEGHMLCYAGDILGRVTGKVKPLLHRVRQPVDGPGSRTALIFYADTVRTMRLPDGQLVNDIIEAKLKKIGQI